MIQPQTYWEPGERLIDWVERAVATTKVWTHLEELPPSSSYRDAFEAEAAFWPEIPELARRGDLLVKGHQEDGGVIIVNLYLGGNVLRRAHIGGNHQEPGGGPLISGPHIHFPTTKYSNIGSIGNPSRSARSRVIPWNVPIEISFRGAVYEFAKYVNIFGQPSEQPRLPGGS